MNNPLNNIAKKRNMGRNDVHFFIFLPQINHKLLNYDRIYDIIVLYFYTHVACT